MINLLPPDIKTGYVYARRNVRLRKWVVMFLFALIGLGVIGTYGLLTLHQSTLNYSKQAEAIQTQLQAEKLTKTKQQVQDISNSLKLAVQVLSNEVLFSKLIQQVGAVMPSGSALTTLNISQVKGGLQLEALATNYSTATQVQVNLADPDNKIFSKVDINSINCGTTNTTGETTASPYPCKVNLRALFDTNNPFLFINQGKKKL